MLLFSPKENSGAKYALKAVNDPLVMVSVLGEFEVVEQRGGTGKTDDSAPLQNGKGCNPNGRDLEARIN